MNFIIASHYGLEKKHVASQRIYFMSKALVNKGHNVYLVTSKANGVNTYCYKSIIELCKIKNIESPIFTYVYRENQKKKTQCKNNITAKNNILKTLSYKIYNIVRSNHIFYNRIYDPTDNRFYRISKYRYIRNITKLYRNIRGECCLITSANPPIMHEIGYIVSKKNPYIKWIADYRDPIIDNVYLKIKSTRKLQKINTNALKRSYMITVVSNGSKELLVDQSKSKDTREKIITVYNGYEYGKYKSNINKNCSHKKKITIVYTGTIYKGLTDIEYLIEILKGSKLSEKIEIVYAGASSIVVKPYLDECKHFLIDCGFVTKTKAQELQEKADILLLLKAPWVEHGIITGKFFEYLRLQKRVLVIGDSDEEFNRIAMDIGGVDILPYDKLKIIEYLTKITHEELYKNNINEKQLKKYDWKNQIEKVILHIEKKSNIK